MATASGCANRFARANEFAQEGKYVEAAELFDQLVREKPGDPEVLASRDRARQYAVEQTLSQAREARLEERHDDAMVLFGQGLGLRARWALKVNGAIESTVDDLAAYSTALLVARVRGPIAAGAGLEAEHRLARFRALLGQNEMKSLATDLKTQVTSAGARSCQALSKEASPKSPYWRWWVSRYCAHFGVEGVSPVPLPDAAGALAPSVRLQGAQEGQNTAVATRLDAAFKASPWFDPLSTQAASALAQGSFRANYVRAPLSLLGQWTEQVPYTVQVAVQRTKQVPYQDTEHYTEQHPYTAYRQGLAVTEQQTVHKTRQVTRFRTETYTEQVPETRTRGVPREFRYAATQVRVQYDFEASLALRLPGGLSLSAAHQQTYEDTGLEHDVSFPAANVHPTRPSFTNPSDWFSTRAGEVGRALSEALHTEWRVRFCAAPPTSIDEAARCARGAETLPPAVMEVLTRRLGDDARHLHTLR